jgi:hypothetical protein
MDKRQADLHEEAKKRFKLAMDAWAENRRLWLEDTKFLDDLDQWPEAIKKLRAVPGQERPCLVVDKLGQYVNQIVNDGRQNRPAVKVRPVEDGDDKVADAFQGIIRHIWDRSKADQAADTALRHAVVGGWGFMRLATEYADTKSFNQEIVIKRVRNPLSVVLDPGIKEADGSDAKYGFVISKHPKDEFERKWPKAEAVDWKADGEKYNDGWMEGDDVVVCEYFYQIDAPVTLHLLEDNTVVADEDYQRALKELGGAVPSVKDTREIPGCKVKWCRMTGAEILEEGDWLGKYIPLIPVFGNEADIEGRLIYSGLIRKAKDAQRLYNFSRSAFAERVAMTPKAPFMAPDEAIEGKKEWATANSGNHQVLRYKAFGPDGQPMPQPSRVQPADVPAGFAQDMQISEHDIQGALGMYNASLGEKSNEKSGRAIMARQREGDTATFHYQDNQSRAIGYLGLQLVDIIPKYLDSRRVVRILGEDGTATQAMVDPDIEGATADTTVNGEALTIYNLNAGKYDVAVAAGPSYTTKRQEALEAGMQLLQANPAAWQLIGDVIVRNADWPGADEIADRLKKMLPPQLQQQPDAKNLPPEAQAIKAQATQMLQQQADQIQAAEQGIQERDAKIAEDEKKIAQLELQVIEGKRREAELVIQEAQETIAQAQGAAEKHQQLEAQNQALATQPNALQALLQALAEMVQSLHEMAHLAAQGHAESANAMRETGAQIAAGNQALGQHILAANAELASAVKAPRVTRGKTSRGTTIETTSEVMQ